MVRSARNCMVTANRLPSEVLAKVLSFRHDDRDLISATHVCERWRSTLLSIPLLWTELVAFGDPDRTSTYLERSKGAPLYVSIGVSALDYPTEDTPWICRMVSLCIDGDQEEMESIVRRLCLPAPSLRSLTFNRPSGPHELGSMGHPIHIPPGFLGQQIPSLQNLTFHAISPSPLIVLPLQYLTNLEWTDSFVAIGEILDLLASAPLLEVVTLDFQTEPMPGVEPFKVITLNKLRKLDWVNGGSFSLMPFLIAPELEDLRVSLTYDPRWNKPSVFLSPHRGRLPLLVEPTVLRYLYLDFIRRWYFTSTSGQLAIYEFPNPPIGDPPTDRWLSPETPISFRGIKELAVEGYHGCPLAGGIPIEQFENLEGLELMGEVDRLLHVIRPGGNTTGRVFPVPLLSYLELHPVEDGPEIPFEMLAEILRERKEAGHGVRTVRIVGNCRRCSSEEASELTKFVDALILDETPGLFGK